MLLYLISAAMFVAPAFPSQAAQVELLRLKSRSFDRGSRITIELSGETKYEITPMRGRIQILLKGCKSAIESVPDSSGDPLISSLALEPKGEDLMVTISLKGRANLSAFMTRSPYKLIIDLFPVKERTKPSPKPAPAGGTVKPRITRMSQKAKVKRSTPPAPKPKPEPERKPEPQTEPQTESQTSKQVDKSVSTTNPNPLSSDFASMLAQAESEDQESTEIQMPKVKSGISPLFLAQFVLNLAFLSAIFLLWRKINRLSSRLSLKEVPSAGKEFSEILDEVVDLGETETPREEDDPKVRKIKGMLAEGLSVDEIAKRTGISKGEIELISSLSEI
jgi:hypothetical protein